MLEEESSALLALSECLSWFFILEFLEAFSSALPPKSGILIPLGSGLGIEESFIHTYIKLAVETYSLTSYSASTCLSMSSLFFCSFAYFLSLNFALIKNNKRNRAIRAMIRRKRRKGMPMMKRYIS